MNSDVELLAWKVGVLEAKLEKVNAQEFLDYLELVDIQVRKSLNIPKPLQTQNKKKESNYGTY